MEAGGKVDGRGGRRKRGWAPGWKSSYWYAVSDFASSVGRTRQTKKRTERGVQRGVEKHNTQGVHAHTRSTHAQVTPFS